MSYDYLRKLNIFNTTKRNHRLRYIIKAYNYLFEREEYKEVKPYIDVYLIDLKKEIPFSVAVHKTSRMIDCPKRETPFSGKTDGFNIYIYCFEGITNEYIDWLICKNLKHIELLLNKKNYPFLFKQDELSEKRVISEENIRNLGTDWKSSYKDRLSMEMLTDQFAKNFTGHYYNQVWRKKVLSETFGNNAYNPELFKTSSGEKLLKALENHEIRFVEAFKRNFFDKYYKTIDLPDDENWQKDKAWRLHKMTDFRRSNVTLNKLVQLNPYNEEYYKLIAINLFYLNEYQDAVEFANKAAFNSPACSEIWYFKANCFYKLKNYSKAISCVEKAMETREDIHYFYTFRGMSEFNLKKYKEALEDFKKALSLFTQQAKAWCLRGYCELYSNKIDSALKCFNKALTISPNYIDAIFGKAFILKRKNKFEEALVYFSKIQEFKPDDTYIYKVKRECILAINKPEKETSGF